jgi:hypothetical protein
MTGILSLALKAQSLALKGKNSKVLVRLFQNHNQIITMMLFTEDKNTCFDKHF